MKIALDARWIFEQTSGIGEHTRLLIKGLHALDTPHEWVLLFDDEERAERVTAETGCTWAKEILPYELFSLQNQIKLPRWLRREGVDVYHATNYMMPLPGFPRHRQGRVRAVITIHDLIPMVFRDHAPRSRKSRFYPIYAHLMREVAARADAIITVSASSRDDIIRLLRLPEKAHDKIRVVYNGLHPRYTPDPDTPRKNPPEVLYVGRLDPYKNVPQLVSAFGESRKNLPIGTRLRIIGPPDERYPEAMTIARQLDLFPHMDWEGHVDDATLLDAYRRASVVVLPSHYEGFGLPVAEAMACGTPVICSNASSLPEVAGEDALFVPPGDLHALADALTEVLTTPKTARRLAEAGPKRAQRFTVETMARETLAVYESLIQTSSTPPPETNP
ncbi:MAG: glycosyltransferase family 4 protein [Verrucomicrobia bacterium]|nr:glycosyltransferase family 4 protein [Verrucomicrobiota bacterium]MCH8513614.1 glycosyltransferase family 4 protein [Kiritimatiellia bacterium]